MVLGFCKDATDKKKAFGAYLTDLSKAFNGLCHVFTKLHAYCFDISSLNSLQDYLSKCKQRIKVDTFLVPGKIFHLNTTISSILGTLSFNIFMRTHVPDTEDSLVYWLCR